MGDSPSDIVHDVIVVVVVVIVIVIVIVVIDDGDGLSLLFFAALFTGF